MVLNCYLGLVKNRTIIQITCQLAAEQLKRPSENGNASEFGQQVALVTQYRKQQVMRNELKRAVRSPLLVHLLTKEKVGGMGCFRSTSYKEGPGC